MRRSYLVVVAVVAVGAVGVVGVDLRWKRITHPAVVI